MSSAKVLCSNHPEEATLPLRWLCQLPLCGLAADERLQAIIHRQQVLYFSRLTAAEKYRSFFIAPRKEVQTKCPYPIWKYELFSEAKAALLLPEQLTKPEKNCFPNMTRKRERAEPHHAQPGGDGAQTVDAGGITAHGAPPVPPRPPAAPRAGRRCPPRSSPPAPAPPSYPGSAGSPARSGEGR